MKRFSENTNIVRDIQRYSEIFIPVGIHTLYVFPITHTGNGNKCKSWSDSIHERDRKIEFSKCNWYFRLTGYIIPSPPTPLHMNKTSSTAWQYGYEMHVVRVWIQINGNNVPCSRIDTDVFDFCGGLGAYFTEMFFVCVYFQLAQWGFHWKCINQHVWVWLACVSSTTPL